MDKGATLIKSPRSQREKGSPDSASRQLNGEKREASTGNRWKSLKAGVANFQYQEAKMTLKRRALMHNSSAVKVARYLPHPLWNDGEEIKVMRQPTGIHPGGEFT